DGNLVDLGAHPSLPIDDDHQDVDPRARVSSDLSFGSDRDEIGIQVPIRHLAFPAYFRCVRCCGGEGTRVAHDLPQRGARGLEEPRSPERRPGYEIPRGETSRKVPLERAAELGKVASSDEHERLTDAEVAEGEVGLRVAARRGN